MPFEDILPIFARSFNGAHPDDIFVDFERTPLASASIAQVHRARLKDGTEVAVKVQKPEIPLQVVADLASYRFMMWMMQTFFEYPTSFVANCGYSVPPNATHDTEFCFLPSLQMSPSRCAARQTSSSKASSLVVSFRGFC